MMKNNSLTILVFSVIVFLTSCKPSMTEPNPSAGSIDVSRYVSLGNSITAGFSDAALYYDGQIVAYPNLLAEQFKTIGGGEFKLPLVSIASVGIGGTLASRLVLKYKTDCSGVSSLSPLPIAAAGDFSIFTTNIAAEGPFNNLGVPGAKSFHLLVPGFGKANPFFGRMVASANVNTASVLAEAVAQNPTFFSLFIGNNDVLGYASAGGASDSITSSGTFNAAIDALVGSMTAKGAKGVIGNIPDVTALPYFTTIPYNGLLLTRQGQVDSLNAAYASVGIKFNLGANAFVLALPGAPYYRKLKPNELVLLSTPQDSLKCAGWGSKKALKGQYVLDETEVAAVQNAVALFNNKLRQVANTTGLAYVDVNAFLTQAKKGIVYNGVAISTNYVSGGAFSLDGVHLTPLGNALLANEFIKAINDKFGSTIPQLNVGSYIGVKFP